MNKRTFLTVMLTAALFWPTAWAEPHYVELNDKTINLSEHDALFSLSKLLPGKQYALHCLVKLSEGAISLVMNAQENIKLHFNNVAYPNSTHNHAPYAPLLSAGSYEYTANPVTNKSKLHFDYMSTADNSTAKFQHCYAQQL